VSIGYLGKAVQHMNKHRSSRLASKLRTAVIGLPSQRGTGGRRQEGLPGRKGWQTGRQARRQAGTQADQQRLLMTRRFGLPEAKLAAHALHPLAHQWQ
jgi:hypothetical protein